MKIAAQLASQGQRLGQSIGMEEPKGETRVGSSPSGHTLGVDGAFVTNPATTCSRSGDSGLSWGGSTLACGDGGRVDV